MFRSALFALLTCYSFSNTTAVADEVRNGGDSRPLWENASWFTGGKPVRYCIEMDSDFGVTIEFARTQFQNALSTWDEYVNQKKIWFGYPKFRIATDFRIQNSCTGREDFKLKLGGIDAETRKAKKVLSLQDPVAFAFRTSFNPLTGWGKGFVWIKNTTENPATHSKFPDWSKGDTLLGIFLHELGHVFGNNHSDGSIMTEKIVDVLWSRTVFDDPAPDTPDLNTIDWEIELYSCRHCAFTKSGHLSKFLRDEEAQARNFQFLTGRNPVGNIEVTVSQTELAGTIYRGSLTVKDSLHTEVLSYSLIKESDSVHVGAPVFISYVAAMGVHRQGAMVHFGNLELSNGNRVPIILERNMNEHQVEISVLNNGVKTPIFVTTNKIDMLP
jgi:hypothetical protein